MSEPQYVKIAAPVKWLSLFIDRFYVGQNVYEASSKGVPPNGQKDWNSAVQAWYSEVKDFNKGDVSPYK
jgi:hypothetical protein